MQKFTHFLKLILLFNAPLYSQSDPWADAVTFFQPGTGQNAGQSDDYFPQNVLGPPDTVSMQFSGNADPNHILSLGLGGEITLAFTNNAIIDGPGVDFTIFENAFIRQFGASAGKPFAEPGKVAVSKDGHQFFEFPFDSLSLAGLAGVTPTNGSADPTNPDSSGGDSFDLATTGLDTARFVKITDVTAIIKDNPSHPFWDPTLSGFDLDAVVAVHSAPAPTTTVVEVQKSKNKNAFLQIYPNPARAEHHFLNLTWRANQSAKIDILNLRGQRLKSIQTKTTTGSYQLNISAFPAGVYFVLLDSGAQKISGEFTVVH